MVSGYLSRRDLSERDIDGILRSCADWVARNAEIRTGGISGWLRSEYGSKNVNSATVNDMIRRHNDAAHYANSLFQPSHGYTDTEIHPKVCDTVRNRGYYPREFERPKSLNSIMNMCDITLEHILDEYGIPTRRISLCNIWNSLFTTIVGTSKEAKLSTLLDYLGVNLTDHESSRPDRYHSRSRPNSPCRLFNNLPPPLPSYAPPLAYGGWGPYPMPVHLPMPAWPRSPPIPPRQFDRVPPSRSLRRSTSQEERLNADLPPRLNYGFSDDVEEDTANWIRGIKDANRRQEDRLGRRWKDTSGCNQPPAEMDGCPETWRTGQFWDRKRD